ncbi:MAG TPA: amino acid permease [Bacteroidia bacterium]|nr:amino acid permease [Bacteroidia bacterium]
MSLFRKKSLEGLLAQAAESDKGLKRTLTAWSLVALGIGAIIGAGLFVRTAAASADAAGPAVTLSFVVAAIGCAFAGLCYAEFSAMIPIAGSAYTYAYTTMGEIFAWIIGWALILEYALGAATVSIAWSEYLNKLLGGKIPYEWCHSPMEHVNVINEKHLAGVADWGVSADEKIGFSVADSISMVKGFEASHTAGVSDKVLAALPESVASNAELYTGMINLPAVGILFLLTLLLIKGTQESAFVNAIIVFLKTAIVLVFIAIGWGFINPDNHTPYLIPEGYPGHDGFFQHGWGGIIGGAGIVFFAFIGFDAVSTAAQEAKNPKRDMPIGILGSLAVCTVLYILFSWVLTGVAPWTDFADPLKGKEASVAYAISNYMPGYEWLATAVTVAILAGFSSVILVMLMGQSRVFFSMSNDGLLPKIFSHLHPKFRTPYKSNMMLFLFVGIFAAFIPGDIAGDLTSIGTLLAFVLVCAGIWIMRVKSPNTIRPFRTPGASPKFPIVPLLGILVCTLMIIGLDVVTQLSALGWMLFGLIIYFIWSRKTSKLNEVTELFEKK